MSLVFRIALLRPLARYRPLRWGPRLAEALVTRSQLVSGLPGWAARRTAAAEEAVALCRRLAAEWPDRHGFDLARALVARIGVTDGQPAAEAIDQLREAIGHVDALRRDLYDEDPAAHRSDLAQALGKLAHTLAALGGDEEAERLTAEAETLAEA